MALSGVVQLVLQVVLAAVHRSDATRLGLDGDQADPQSLVLVGGAGVLHGRDRGLLGALLDRGGDGEATAVDLGLAPALVDQFLLHRLEDVPRLPGELVALLLLLELGERDLGAFGGSQPFLLDHAVEHVVPALREPFLEQFRLIVAGRLDDGRQGGPFGQGHLVDGLAVVGLGGRLDAVGAAAEVDGVQVVGQDLVLGLDRLELDREHQFIGLTGDVLILGQVGVLDVLLGDGGPALRASAGQVVPQRPADALGREPTVVIERAVLGGEHGMLHLEWDVLERHAGATHAADTADLGLAVGVHDLGGLGDGDVVGLRHGKDVNGDREHPRTEHGQCEQRAQYQLPGRDHFSKAGFVRPRVVDHEELLLPASLRGFPSPRTYDTTRWFQ